MREILFRGKRIDNGEWVEGYYVKTTLGKDIEPSDVIFVPWNINRSEQWGWIKVLTETLCQYIGLKDKNGKRIWENDIVICNRREKEAKYKVVWDKTYADFRIEKLNGLGCMPICIEEGNTPVFGRHYECIGNVFDNPELLKKQ